MQKQVQGGGGRWTKNRKLQHVVDLLESVAAGNRVTIYRVGKELLYERINDQATIKRAVDMLTLEKIQVDKSHRRFASPIQMMLNSMRKR